MKKAVYGSFWASMQPDINRVGYDPKNTDVFHFSRCEYDPKRGVATLGYRFDDHPELIELIEFDRSHSQNKFSDIATERAFLNALHILHLIAGVSYYKAGIPSRLAVDTLAEDAELEVFLLHLYQHGLAEFSYRNSLSLKPYLNFEFTGSYRLAAQAVSKASNGDLLAMGGGKDSLVAAEMVKSLGRVFTTVAVGSSDLIAETAKLTGAPFIRIGRKLAPELQSLNAAGAWNGHVPVTAINAAILVCQALLSGFGHVIFANEASASSANLRTESGEDINHQFSKGLDYEQRFRSLLKLRVAKTPGCFSLLRPWRELAIVKYFSQYRQYFNTFSSCNRNFHLQGLRMSGRWCGDCPKCRFATLMLSLWLPRNKIIEIIGRDMLADNAQIGGFAQLCGFEGHKPFECVGEIEESRIAVLELGCRQEYQDSPVIKALLKHVQPVANLLPSLDVMLQPLSNHLLPDEFSVLVEGSENETS